MKVPALAALALLFSWSAPAGGGPIQPAPDPLAPLLTRLEQVLSSGTPQAYVALTAETANRELAEAFARDAVRPDTTRAAVRERDRTPLPGAEPGRGYRLLLEVFIERGRRGRILVWRMDVRRSDTASAETGWVIAAQDRLAYVEGLYQLTLDRTREYAIKNLTLRAVDLTLTIPSGTAFVAETDAGPTALVIRGRGEMNFSPGPAAERGQVRLFCGADTLKTRFDALFIRLEPGEMGPLSEALAARAVDLSDYRKSLTVFNEHIGQSYALNLRDLSEKSWSLTPSPGDIVAEIHTNRFGVLTYARAHTDEEDVTLFDRKRRRNISLYMSPQKLAAHGAFYNEDDDAEYDVLGYDVDTDFSPERDWIEGRTTLTVRATRSLANMTIRLAESLAVRAAVSPELGRLTHLRVIGQNSVLLSLPSIVKQGDTVSIAIAYSGRLASQPLEREAIGVAQESQFVPDAPLIPAEPRYIYSNRSYWYAQSTVSDYAPARIRVTLPTAFDCIATGELAETPTIVPGVVEAGQGARRQFLFQATKPVRYLAVVISRFTQVQSTQLQLDGANRPVTPSMLGPDASDDDDTPALSRLGFFIHANPRQQSRARGMSDRTAAILQYYTSLLGEAPYPTFTLAVTESTLPGGHSPAYFAVLSEPVATSTPTTWRNDPVSFDNFPPFFLAHEIAHQWWGQAVGWKNYHEQWLSEGFAQYFAALYARRDRGEDVFDNLMRQMRRWAMANSGQGPIYLGYRVGHIKGDGRMFRAVVYNKSAVVLHMLRRLVGDEVFFAGLRQFYTEFRFNKAGTDDLRRIMAAHAGYSLDRFFQRWIYASTLPHLKFSYRVQNPADASPEATVRFEQLGDEIFDVPVTVTMYLDNGDVQDVVVRVTDRITELTVPLAHRVVRVEVNRDNAALAEISR